MGSHHTRVAALILVLPARSHFGSAWLLLAARIDAAHLIIVRCILPRHVQNQIRSTRVVLQELSHIKNTASDEQPHRLLSLVLLDLLHCVRLPLILLVRLRRLFRRLEGESGRWRVEVRGVGTQSTRRYALSLRHTPFWCCQKIAAHDLNCNKNNHKTIERGRKF